MKIRINDEVIYDGTIWGLMVMYVIFNIVCKIGDAVGRLLVDLIL